MARPQAPGITKSDVPDEPGHVVRGNPTLGILVVRVPPAVVQAVLVVPGLDRSQRCRFMGVLGRWFMGVLGRCPPASLVQERTAPAPWPEVIEAGTAVATAAEAARVAVTRGRLRTMASLPPPVGLVAAIGPLTVIPTGPEVVASGLP